MVARVTGKVHTVVEYIYKKWGVNLGHPQGNEIQSSRTHLTARAIQSYQKTAVFPATREGKPSATVAGNDALCSAFTAAVKTEVSDKKELPVLHANGAHDKTELQTRWSCLTRHVFAAAVKMEVSDEKELRESHANGAHGETELPNETELPDETVTELPDENGQRDEPSLHLVWGRVIFQGI